MPRAGLTPERVVACAGDLVDRSGYDALSLADLADQLGIRAPSLYKHVTGLGDLRRRVALDGLRGLEAALRDAAVGRAGVEALRGVGAAYRGYARTHPGRYAAGLRAPAPDDAEAGAVADRLIHLMVAVVGAYGLEGEDAVHAVRGVRAALHGFVALEQAGGFGLPYDLDASFERLVATLDAGLRQGR